MSVLDKPSGGGGSSGDGILEVLIVGLDRVGSKGLVGGPLYCPCWQEEGCSVWCGESGMQIFWVWRSWAVEGGWWEILNVKYYLGHGYCLGSS